MTELDLVFRNREHRTDRDPDVDAMMADAVTEGRQLVRRRRRYAAVGGSAVVVGAVAALVVVLTPSSTPQGAPPAGEPSAPSGMSTGMSVMPTVPATHLVRAPATPRTAPVSLGLLPNGWRYVGGDASYVAYASVDDPLAKLAGSFEGKIIVGPHEAFEPQDKNDFPLRAGRRLVQYDGGPTRDSMMHMYVNRSITIDFQWGKNAHLTKTQALQLAASLTIRSIKNPSRG